MPYIAVVLVVLAACAGADSGATTEPAGEAMAIFTHCGFYEIEFAGAQWTPSSIERGSSPEGTGFNTTEGTIKLVGGKVHFVAESGLEVIYEPAPPDLPPVPGCD